MPHEGSGDPGRSSREAGSPPAGPPVPAEPADWHARAAELFDEYCGAVATAGFPPARSLRLVDEKNAYPSYDPARRVIRFGLPSLGTLSDRLFWGYYAALLGVDAPADAARYAATSLPLVMAHEVSHHLRHRYRTYSGDHFVEEQVAQVIAVAWVAEHPVHRRSIPELRRVAAAATRRLRRLTPQDTRWERDFHLGVGEVLADEHLIGWRELYRAERLARLHDAAVEEVLVEKGWVREEQVRAAGLEVDEARRAFDARYMRDLAEYWHFGFAWLHSYLEHGSHPSFPEALDRYLRR